jgi:MHS family citrate/tricarballylate:H+ symporter-like MFS transporter
MAGETRALSLPQLGAVVAGNALEFYDFLTFGFFAVQIGTVFFPGHDTTGSLLLTLATFGVGFLTRPLGGMVIGTLGDTWGRKPAMLFSFSLMGLSIVGLALTPSYAAIGWAAPMLVVGFRLCQGFALGGEVGPVTAFLLEAAPVERRGLYVSLQNATQYLATLVAGAVGLVLAKVLSPEHLTQWGWRIAFLLGACVVPFALVIRRRLPETLHVQTRPSRGGEPLWLGLLGLGMLASATIATYTMNYIATFALHTLGMTPAQAFGGTMAGGSFAAIGALAGGALGDRIGRKPVMIGATLALLALALPCFMAMAAYRSLDVLVLCAAALAFCVGLMSGAIMGSVTESMPASLRAGSVGIVYALAISGFGGTAQFILTWLIAETGSPLVPAWYLSGALVVGLVAMLAMKESAPVRTGGLRH